MTLSPEHAAYLEAQAVDLELAQQLGVRSVASQGDLDEELREPFGQHLPGILYPWTGPYGNSAPQLRPDEPTLDAVTDRPIKYRFVRHQAPALWAVRPLEDATTVLIVEGTKQCLVAARYAPPDLAVYGVAGCQNWTKDQIPIKDLAVADGKNVLVAFDADAGSNLDVFTAGAKLGIALKAEGATSVRWVRLPAGGTAGLDDVLARRDPDRRADFLARIIADARDKIADRKPAAPRKKKRASDGAVYFDDNGLLPLKLAEEVLKNVDAILTAENVIAMYAHGVYGADGSGFHDAVVDLLGNDFRIPHRSTAEAVAMTLLRERGRVLTGRPDAPVVNLRNGLLDLRTGELSEHTPAHLSTVQLPVAWDPTARCPHYERWLQEVIPDQIDDLEEVASTMLDPSRTPPKAVFLFGPSRSGKSTFLRILEALAGPKNRSSVTLQQLAEDRFAAANLYGVILNAAADLSSTNVEDLSMFKMLTGEDSVHANRKYGAQFSFRNQALFAFSANEVPTVGESSRAYRQRVKPFGFDRSFAGREDPAIEDRITAELPGILVRFVRAWQRLGTRGSYQATAARVQQAFDMSSDRVQLWVAERCVITEARQWAIVPASAMTTRRELARLFNAWALEQGGRMMGERKIVERLTSIDGVVDVRDPKRVRGLNLVPTGLFDVMAGDEAPTTERQSGTLALPLPPIHPDIEAVEESSNKSSELNREKGGLELPPCHLDEALVFDLETGSAGDLYTAERGSFVRLGGTLMGGEYERTTDFDALARLLQDAPLALVGHNILGFDLQALARHHGLLLQPLVARDGVRDTLLMARYLDPPMAKEKGRDFSRRYDLDSLAKKYVDPEAGKSGDLKAMAKEHGGYDKIPLDDPDYNAYLEQDVRVNADLFVKLDAELVEAGPTAVNYVLREHKVAAIAAQFSLNGFKVDLDVLHQRLQRNDEIRQYALQVLHERYGVPLLDGKGEPSAAPLATRAGKDAIIAALRGYDVNRWWTTGKTEDIATSREAMQQLALQHMDKPAVTELCKLVIAVVSLRSVYQTVQKNLIGDRVHPTVSMKQSTGRWSLSKPGLTVMGKRGGKWREREMFVADDGHVVIAVDLSQIDMRSVAGLSGDAAYIEMLSSGDAHASLAQELFGDPGMREVAKPISHGWNYGRGIKAISQSNEIAPDLVIQFDREMRERFPRLVSWRDEVRAEAESGRLLDNGFGRRMRPEPSRAHTQGPALMGQGCARDLMMEGLLRLPQEILPMLRAQVHDEVVLSVPAADAVEIQRAVIDAMSFTWDAPGGIPVPITAEGGPTDRRSWGQVYAK